jgi:hypothetical protein
MFLSLMGISFPVIAGQTAIEFFQSCEKFPSGRKNGRHSLFGEASRVLKAQQTNLCHTG